MILDSIYVTLCDQIYLHPISQCCFKFFYYFQRCEGIPLNGEVFAPCGDADRAPSGAGTIWNPAVEAIEEFQVMQTVDL